MAINFKLVQRDLVPVGEDDSMGRTWAGWDDTATLEEIWEVNRGQWVVNGERLRAERYATMSFEGTIRLVAEIEGSWTDPEGYRVLEGEVLPGSHPVSAALVGQPLEGGRNPVSYFDTAALESAEAGPTRAVLLTVNPARYDFYAIEAPEVQAAIALGHPAPGTWSVANRVQGIGPGDVVYLLQQGEGRRGIIGSGTVESAHARRHPGECIMGVLTFIERDDNGDIDPESGEFWIGPFDPDAGELSPIAYDFQPRWDDFTPRD